MSWKPQDYDDIPGTYVFDGRHSHDAYALNKLLFSFNEQANRDEFDRDPAAYCDRFKLMEPHRTCVLEQDFLQMLRLGANIYYMAKMAIPRGTSVQDAGARFQGITTEAFISKLLEKRKEMEEKINRRGDYWHG